MFIFIVYCMTVAMALLYGITMPSYYAPSRVTLVLNWLRIISAGIYLGILLLYLPTIHFIINMGLFTFVVGVCIWYKIR